MDPLTSPLNTNLAAWWLKPRQRDLQRVISTRDAHLLSDVKLHCSYGLGL